MKKALRFVSLVAAVALVAFALNLKPAYALGSCENINGGPCSPNGKTLRCLWNPNDGDQGLCICTDGLWDCL
ncbi:MAG TPA: hypothetical protein VF173_19275 [Thermoanaerobaculia bacterium]|nr:hypothetical protein [Thermoanaerobaculia bacterium]